MSSSIGFDKYTYGSHTPRREEAMRSAPSPHRDGSPIVRNVPVIIKKPTAASDESRGIKPARSIPIVIQQSSSDIVITQKVNETKTTSRKEPRLSAIDEDKVSRPDSSSIRFEKVRQEWESRCKYNEDNDDDEDYDGYTLPSNGNSSHRSAGSGRLELCKSLPSASKESQVTIIHRTSESAQSLHHIPNNLVQFSDVPQLYDISMSTPVKTLRSTKEHLSTPARTTNEIFIPPNNDSHSRAVPIVIKKQEETAKRKISEPKYYSDRSSMNSAADPVEMIEVAPYDQDRFLHIPTAGTQSSTMQSVTSKSTYHYEGETDQMFKFLEKEQDDLRDLQDTINISVEPTTAKENHLSESKVSSRQGVDVYELSKSDLQSPELFSLSEYRRIQQQHDQQQKTGTVEKQLVGPGDLTNSPVSRFGRREPRRSDDQSVPLSTQQSPRQQRGPRYSPAGPTPLSVPIEIRDGYYSHAGDRTPPNPYRNMETPKATKDRLNHYSQVSARNALLREDKSTESPGDKMRRKITQLVQRLGVGGGDDRKKKKEISKSIPDLSIHHSRNRDRTERSEMFQPRPLTPDGDGTLRIRHSPVDYNVSLRGSKTPNVRRRILPLATSTPLVGDAPRTGQQGKSTANAKMPWQSHHEMFTPSAAHRVTKSGDDVLVAGGEAADLARAVQANGKYQHSSEYAINAMGEPISAIKRTRAPNSHMDDQNVIHPVRTPPALATSTPRHSLTTAEGHRHLNSLGTWGEDTFVSSITTATSRRGPPGPQDAKAAIERSIARLQSQAEAQSEQVKMSEKVLQLARKKHKMLNEVRDRLPAELTAARTLLLARERLTAIRLEVQRLENLSRIHPMPPPVANCVRGTMLINNIAVQLGPRFCHQREDTSTYSFLILLRCGSEVEATSPITILDTQRMRAKQLHFAESIRFSNLPLDFSVVLEVFTMRLRDSKNDPDPSCSSFASKARLFFSPSMTRRQMLAPNDAGIQPVGEFVRCGSVTLSRDTVGKQLFYLDGVEYPLEGTIEIHTQCTSLPPAVEVNFSGFLTMYQLVSGQGSWVRFWAVLRRGLISFWKDPHEEELEKPAIAQMDLSKCTDERIEPASGDISSRAHSFSVDMLVARIPSIVEHKRVILAADTRELLDEWLSSLNKTLAVIRGEI